MFFKDYGTLGVWMASSDHMDFSLGHLLIINQLPYNVVCF